MPEKLAPILLKRNIEPMIDQHIIDYCIKHSQLPSKDCENITKYTQKNFAPSLFKMISGPLESSFLGFLIKLVGVKHILEIGTFTGYSALSMAEYLPDDGQILTIDKNKKTTKKAMEFWSKSVHGKKIKALNGHGVEILKSINQLFDLIFIDADKANYLEYFLRGLDLLTPKGFIVVDNALWGGKVCDANALNSEDLSTKSIATLNQHIFSRNDLICTLLPIRDGIYLIQKKN